MAAPRALRRPNGPPADPQRLCRTPFNRSLPGLGGPQLLLAQPMLLVTGASAKTASQISHYREHKERLHLSLKKPAKQESNPVSGHLMPQ